MSTDPRRRRATGETALRHARLHKQIAAFADGELLGRQKRAVEEHLLRCRKCQRELALQRGLSRALAREPVPTASADLRRRIESPGVVGRTRR